MRDHHYLIPLVLLTLLPASLSSIARSQEKPLAKTEVARLGKASTVLILSGRGTGTAFCINSDGFFLSSNRVVQSAGGQPIRLVLNPGLKTQQLLTATVIRSDRTLDLALLKVESKEKVPSLPFGSTKGLNELAEVVAVGFLPFRRSVPEREEYPSVNVRSGSISSLQRSGGKLTRILLDVNPGFPGGPVLDRQGKVAGLVSTVSGNRCYAIPVSQIKAFVSKPYVLFNPPLISRRNKHKPVTFQVQAAHVLPSTTPLAVELKLGGEGKERSFRMKGEKGAYSAEVVPVPLPPKKPKVQVTVDFTEGAVSGSANNRDIKIGDRKLDLGRARSIRFGKDAEVVLENGMRIKGPVSNLKQLIIEAGEQQWKLDLKEAKQIVVTQPKRVSELDCTIVVKQDGKEVGTAQQRVSVPHGRLLMTLRGHTDRVSGVVFSPDGMRMASTSFDQTVKIWDTRTGKGLLTLLDHAVGTKRTRSYNVVFSSDGKRLASVSGYSHSGIPGEVKVWSAHNGQKLTSITGHSRRIKGICFSPDGKRLATSSADSTVKVWDASRGIRFLNLAGHTDCVHSVNFSPDGSRIVSGSSDKTVKIWDANTGEELLSLQGHTSLVTSVSFSPDGKRLVSASRDHTMKVWDAQKGKELLTLKGHTMEVSSARFSPDSKRLASASKDQTVKIWDVRTGEELLTLKGHNDWVYDVSFSPDGEKVASVSGDQTVKIWDLADLHRANK